MPALQVQVAQDFWRRAAGLLGRAALAPDAALLIAPCSSVHTFFMRFAIDVVWMDRDGRILQVTPRLGAWRATGHRKAYACMELAAGGAQAHGLVAGQVLDPCSRAALKARPRHFTLAAGAPGART